MWGQARPDGLFFCSKPIESNNNNNNNNNNNLYLERVKVDKVHYLWEHKIQWQHQLSKAYLTLGPLSVRVIMINTMNGDCILKTIYNTIKHNKITAG